MCLIIVNVDGREVPRSYIRNAHRRNSDSFGIMWATRTGELKFTKGLFDYDTIESMFKRLELEGLPYVCHFRMATHGATDYDNSHPFLISSTQMGGVGMVHNGVFSNFGNGYCGGYGMWGRGQGKSDTAEFVDNMINDLETSKLTVSDLFFEETPTLRLLNKGELDGYNKLAFMNGDGEINIVNERGGSWIGGCWYSNEYSIGTLEKNHVKVGGQLLHDLETLQDYLEACDTAMYGNNESDDDEDTIIECDFESEEDEEIARSVRRLIEENAIDAAFAGLDIEELDDELIMHPMAGSNGYLDKHSTALEFDFESNDDESEDTQPISRQAVRDALAEEIANQALKTALEGSTDNEVCEWEQWVKDFNRTFEFEGKSTSSSTALTPLPSYSSSSSSSESWRSKYSHSYTPYVAVKTWEDEMVDLFLA